MGIKDPAASKPADWDDKEKIDDPEDRDKPQHIPDPDAKKPEDWDDDIDGEWEPPSIDNPDYKGKWVHPEIDNPDYTPDDKLYLYKDIGAVGVDVWQVKSGTIFDNFFIETILRRPRSLP